MGLITAGMLKGLGDGTSTFGNFMMQHQGREELQRMRDQDRRELQADRLAAAAGRGGSGGGGNTPFMKSLDEGSMAEEMAAARLGMSVPEFRQFRASQSSGDTGGYKTDVTTAEVVDSGDPLAPDFKTKTEMKLPPGFEQWQADKRRALAEIQSELLYGQHYDEVAKGRGEELKNRVGQGIVGGAMKPAEGAEKVAALKGDGAYGKGGVNQFTGKADDVGESTVEKNEGLANKANRDPGTKPGADTAADKNARALVTSLRTQESNVRRNITKLQEGFETPAKAKKIEEAKAELADITRQLRAAESRLAGPGRGGDNTGIVKPGSKPSLADIFK